MHHRRFEILTLCKSVLVLYVSKTLVPSLLSLLPSQIIAMLQDGCTTAGPTNIGLTAARDAILAAKRESEFEMMARANAETELEAAQRDNCQHRRTEQKLRSELKEAGALAQLVPGFEEQLKRQVEETNSLQTTVCQLQTTLKECKAEMSRKVSRLKAMQV